MMFGMPDNNWNCYAMINSQGEQNGVFAVSDFKARICADKLLICRFRTPETLPHVRSP